VVVEPPPCSGRPRAYEGARRCLGFSLFRMSVAARLRQSPVAGDSAEPRASAGSLGSTNPTPPALYGHPTRRAHF
jgi:hypothetical protein